MTALRINIRSQREFNLLKNIANTPREWRDYTTYEKLLTYTSVVDITPHVPDEQLREFEREVGYIPDSKDTWTLKRFAALVGAMEKAELANQEKQVDLKEIV